MQQHLAGCPARTRLGNKINDNFSRQLPSIAAHRLLSATSSSRQLTQQRLAVSCPAIEQDTEVPSTSGRTRTDGDLIHALFQADAPLADFADVELTDITSGKHLSKLIKAADSIPQLCDLIQLEAPNFTPQSTSHALHKLSKLCHRYFTQLQTANLASREAQQVAWIDYVEPALQTLGQLLIRHMSDCDPWAVAISFWAYGNMQCSDEAVFAALCERGLQIMQQFTPHDCASALVGIAKLRVRPRCQREFVDYLLSHAMHLLSRVDAWKTQEIANVLWSLSRIGAAGPSRRALLEGLLEMIMWRLPEFKMSELSIVVYSCGRLQLRMPLQLARITAHMADRVQEMRAIDAAHVVWGCAKLGIKPEGNLLEQIPTVVVQRLNEFRSQEICNLLYGYGCLRYQHPHLLETLAEALPQRMHAFSTQDVCLTIWSYGMLRYCPESDELFDTACRVLSQRSNRLIPMQLTMAVKSFARVMYQPAPEFMQQVSQLCMQKMHQFSPLELSQLLWAYAKLGYRDVQLFEAVVATFIQSLTDGNRRFPKATIDTVVRACEMVGFWPQLLVDTAEMRNIIVKTTKQRESAGMEQLVTVMPDSPTGAGSEFVQQQASGSAADVSAVNALNATLLEHQRISDHHQQLQQQLHVQQQQQPVEQSDQEHRDQPQQPLAVLEESALLQQQSSSWTQEQHDDQEQQQQYAHPQQQRSANSSSKVQQRQQQVPPLQLLRPPSRLGHQQPQQPVTPDPGATAAADRHQRLLLKPIWPKHPLAAVGNNNGRNAKNSTRDSSVSVVRLSGGHAQAQLQS